MEILRTQAMETTDIQVEDKILIELSGLGAFKATAHKVTPDKGVLFIFDEYVTKRPMNANRTNEGGFEQSDLKKWMDTELMAAFPEWLKDRISGLSIPTVGQIFGHDEEWDNTHFEPDTDEQLPLMKERRNRFALYQDGFEWGWLRNATKKEVSSAGFAFVLSVGSTDYSNASSSYGVRPEFWLGKEKSRGPVPRNGSEKNENPGRSDDFEKAKQSVLNEIRNKGKEIRELEKEYEELETREQLSTSASEIKKLVDSFVAVGFSEDHAIQIVVGLATAFADRL